MYVTVLLIIINAGVFLQKDTTRLLEKKEFKEHPGNNRTVIYKTIIQDANL